VRYLLSESSASILRGLAADRGGVSFEDRRIDRASPARPRPFACRVAEVDSAAHMLCYLPPLVAQAIRWEASALAPQGSLGSVDSPWVDLGSWTPSQRVWLAIAPPVDPPAGSTSGGYAGGWALVLAANPPTSLSGHAAYAHLVAAMESGTSGASRFVQYHLGSMLLAGGDSCQDSYGLDCNATTGAGGRQLDITLTRTPCGGEPEDVDTCSVPLISGRVVADILSLVVSGSALVLTYSWAEYQDGVMVNDGQSTVACPVTTCED